MAQRFFHEDLRTGDIVLSPAEAQHVRVSRLGEGDRILLIDGKGHEGTGTIVRLGRREVTVRVEQVLEITRELPGTLVLCVSLPHGDRQRWLIEKATELGVSHLLPVVATHSDAHARQLKAERVRRWIIEASKQCGRTVLMTVGNPKPWQEVCATVTEGIRIFCHPGGAPLESSIAAQSNGQTVAVAVGPEGGWSDEELALATRHGWTPAGLGPTILRVETAALVACAVARTWLLRR